MNVGTLMCNSSNDNNVIHSHKCFQLVLYFQGDAAEYIYLIYSGEVVLEVDGKPVVQNGDPDGNIDEAENDDDEEIYQVLGQMAALTSRPHTETAKVTSGSCILFLLDRMTFLRATRRRPKALSQTERVRLLKASAPSDLLDYLEDDEVALEKLASAMTIRQFSEGETIYPVTDSLTVVTEGTIQASIERPGYDDFLIGPNEVHSSFGWRTFEDALWPSSMKKSEPLTLTCSCTYSSPSL